MDQNIMSGTGFLKVRVSAAREALPIENALVYISQSDDDNNGVIYSLRTNNSGETETVSLGAPPASTGQAPGGRRPFSLYNVEVSKPGYYTVVGTNVPIFDGVVSVLPISFVPVAEFDELNADAPENIIYNNTPENNLYEGDNNG